MNETNKNEMWLLWKDGQRDPFMNMAVDQLLLDRILEARKPVIRIYGWDRPSVSIGYVQKYSAAPSSGYAVVRRPTGGGVVFHDTDLTYTAVVPDGHYITGLNRIESYHVFHRAVLRMLSSFGKEGFLSSTEHPVPDRATMVCFTTPTRYDVISGDSKYAGAAQRRTKTGILHQGSISLDAGNGDASLIQERLISALAEEFNIVFSEYIPAESFLSAAAQLAKDKYSTPEWNMNK